MVPEEDRSRCTCLCADTGSTGGSTGLTTRRALLLLSLAGALCRSELVGLDVADLIEASESKSAVRLQKLLQRLHELTEHVGSKERPRAGTVGVELRRRLVSSKSWRRLAL